MSAQDDSQGTLTEQESDVQPIPTPAPVPAPTQTPMPVPTPTPAAPAAPVAPVEWPSGPNYRVLKRTTTEMTKKVDAFDEAVKWLPNMKQRMDDLSDKIYSAEKEKQDKLGKIEREIANYELEVITKALLKQNKIPKDQMELDQLRQQERMMDGEKDAKKRKMEEEVRIKVEEQARFKNVEFEQKYSEFQAREQAFFNEKRTLLDTIASLRAEIESQKKLSSDIAKSAKN